MWHTTMTRFNIQHDILSLISQVMCVELNACQRDKTLPWVRPLHMLEVRLQLKKSIKECTISDKHRTILSECQKIVIESLYNVSNEYKQIEMRHTKFEGNI